MGLCVTQLSEKARKIKPGGSTVEEMEKPYYIIVNKDYHHVYFLSLAININLIYFKSINSDSKYLFIICIYFIFVWYIFVRLFVVYLQVSFTLNFDYMRFP